jgi:mannose-6-phosphate isomerase-like protein (cupin superfamily)
MSGKRIDKPWGYEEIWAHTDKYVGKVLHIFKGRRLSEQFHRVKDETIYVLSGDLQLEINGGEQILILSPGESYRIETGVIHRFVASEHGTDVRLMEVSTPELGDVVRTEDDYGRE